MGVYLGHDKVAGPGLFCNVSGSASKNLFNKDTMVEFKNGYRLYTDGTFNNNSSFYGLKIPVQPNTTYTSSSNLTDTNLWSDLCFFDKGMNFISGVEGRANKTFTTPANCYFVTYAIYNQYQWFQLEKGSATEYEKYYEPIISIKDSKGAYHEVPYMTGKVSKNLFNKNDVLKGYWINNGKLEKNALWSVGGFFKVEPDTTYSYSSTLISGASEMQTTIMYYDIDGNHITHSYFQTLTKTEKTPSNCYYARITYRNDVHENIQFEKGSTATEYEAYFEPTISIKDSNGVFQEVEFNTPVMLYSSESGTFDSITLTEEVEHFKYVEVFGVGNIMVCSVKIPMGIYNTGSLFTAGVSYQYHCGVSLSGKSMTFLYNRRLNISSKAWDTGNYFKIYRIIGYK